MKKLLFVGMIASLATAGTAVARDGSGGSGGEGSDANGRERSLILTGTTSLTGNSRQKVPGGSFFVIFLDVDGLVGDTTEPPPSPMPPPLPPHDP